MHPTLIVPTLFLIASALPAAEVRAAAAPAHTSDSNQSGGTLTNTAVVNETIRTTASAGGILTVRHGFVLAKPSPAPAGNG